MAAGGKSPERRTFRQKQAQGENHTVRREAQKGSAGARRRLLIAARLHSGAGRVQKAPAKLGLKQARRRQGASKCSVPDTMNRQRKWTFTIGNHFGR